MKEHSDGPESYPSSVRARDKHGTLSSPTNWNIYDHRLFMAITVKAIETSRSNFLYVPKTIFLALLFPLPPPHKAPICCSRIWPTRCLQKSDAIILSRSQWGELKLVYKSCSAAATVALCSLFRSYTLRFVYLRSLHGPRYVMFILCGVSKFLRCAV